MVSKVIFILRTGACFSFLVFIGPRIDPSRFRSTRSANATLVYFLFVEIGAARETGDAENCARGIGHFEGRRDDCLSYGTSTSRRYSTGIREHGGLERHSSIARG